MLGRHTRTTCTYACSCGYNVTLDAEVRSETNVPGVGSGSQNQESGYLGGREDQ